jgi:C_GCAxxG_C_C family probable redox protein
MVEDVTKRAAELFESDLGCAQSVLLAVAESRGVRSDLIPRIATGLCGGVARTRGMCGAVLGAAMAIGLAFGRDEPSDSEDAAYSAVQSVVADFTELHGASNCFALSSCDLGTEEGRARFQSSGQHETCREYVATATRLVLEAIAQREAA